LTTPNGGAILNTSTRKEVETMTVARLIEELKKFDQSKEVFVALGEDEDSEIVIEESTHSIFLVGVGDTVR
jgi:predicted regulator of Ras-like GTPase activity (Roadblock/LC7/MglB family)